MSQSILAYLLRKFWSALVVLTVSAAVMVSLARILLPGIGEYRQEIQTWVSQSLGQPVEIEEIDADWRGWTPNLRLSNIKLLDNAQGRTITRFEHLTISLNILSSLYSGSFVPGHLLVTGVELSLIRQPDGTVTIEGVSSDDENTTAMEKNALAYWLEHQSNLSIESARVSWNDQMLNKPPLIFNNVSLQLNNHGNKHRFTGTAALPDGTGTDVTFILDAEGDLLTRGWSGQLFLEAHGLNPGSILTHTRLSNIKLPEGDLQFRLWSDWKNARLETVTAAFEAKGMQFGTAEKAFDLVAARGEFELLRGADDGWEMQGRKLSLETLNGIWPESDFQIKTQKNASGLSLSSSLAFVRLEDLLPMLSSFELFSPQLENYLQQAKVQGDLSNLNLLFNEAAPAEEQFTLNIDFADLQANPVDSIPGLNGLDGQVEIFPRHGSLKLQTRSFQMQIGKVFKQAIWLDEVNGQLNWLQEDDSWQFTSEGLQLISSDLEANLTGDLLWTGTAEPEINLVAEFIRGNVSSTGKFLPYRIMPNSAVEWLEQSLVGGTVVGGGMVLRGNLAHFPFDDHSGVFEVLAQIEDGILDYAEDWPRIEEIEAEVKFSGRGMDIRAVSGKVYDASILHAHASIDNLAKAQQVIIDGSLKGDVLAGYEFISNSPLKESIGKRLDRIGLTNEIKVDLRLDIPLKRNGSVNTRGKVHFEDNTAHQPQFNITLDKLKGTYSFTNDTVADGQFSAIYHNTPVELVMRDNPEQQATVIDIQGMATPDFIKDRLSEAAPGAGEWLKNSGLFGVLKGKTRWRALMELPVDEKNPLRPASLRISTDLIGMSVSAPAPIGKQKQQRFPFSIETPLGEDQDKVISFTYSDILNGKLHLQAGHDGTELKRTEIHLGQNRKPINSDDTLWIGGQLEELELSHWIDFYRQQGSELVATEGQLPTTRIDLGVSRLHGYGQTFNKVDVQASNPAGIWQIELQGEDAQGKVTIPADLQHGTARLRFSHLALHTQEAGSDEKTENIDPRRFPAVEAEIDNLRFNDKELGVIQLSTRPQSAGIDIQQLNIENPAFKIDARGHWLVSGEDHVSRFTIDVRAPELAGLLAHFDYSGTDIEEAETSIEVEAGWPGSLTDFSLEKLDGKLRLDIKQGRVVDVDASAGKIFGLLSLKGLKRRLTLDFNDLFKKGFSFDHLNGSFTLENGHAYTNDMTLLGPSATISINGRTGLVARDYDQLVTVTPAFASSLPVASALFGPVGVGVGAVVFLAEKVFKTLPDKIDKVLSRQYTVSGSWDEPVIERIKETPQPAPANQGGTGQIR